MMTQPQAQPGSRLNNLYVRQLSDNIYLQQLTTRIDKSEQSKTAITVCHPLIKPKPYEAPKV